MSKIGDICKISVNYFALERIGIKNENEIDNEMKSRKKD
jgi:hypothetical protein